MARHFTLQEREFLDRLRKKGKTKKEIAELMGRDRSTIYRELGRNSGQRGYRTPSEILAKRGCCN